MRRLTTAISVLALALVFLVPAFSPVYLYAADACTNGSAPDASGSCVCPSGIPPEDDGTCKLDPFAQACQGEAANSSACTANGSNPISGKDGVILRVINIFSFVIGAASVIMILVGGFRYIISNGDSNSLSTAKNTILYAVIGIVVFLLSRGIITFVINKL